MEGVYSRPREARPSLEVFLDPSGSRTPPHLNGKGATPLWSHPRVWLSQSTDDNDPDAVLRSRETTHGMREGSNRTQQDHK